MSYAFRAEGRTCLPAGIGAARAQKKAGIENFALRIVSSRLAVISTAWHFRGHWSGTCKDLRTVFRGFRARAFPDDASRRGIGRSKGERLTICNRHGQGRAWPADSARHCDAGIRGRAYDRTGNH